MDLGGDFGVGGGGVLPWSLCLSLGGTFGMGWSWWFLPWSFSLSAVDFLFGESCGGGDSFLLPPPPFLS